MTNCLLTCPAGAFPAAMQTRSSMNPNYAIVQSVAMARNVISRWKGLVRGGRRGSKAEAALEALLASLLFMCTATIALMTKIATTAYVNIMNVVVAGSDILILPCLSGVTLHYFVNKPDKNSSCTSFGLGPAPLDLLEKNNPDQPRDLTGNRREHALAPPQTRIGINT